MTDRTIQIRVEQLIRGFGTRALETAQRRLDEAQQRNDARAIEIWGKVRTEIAAMPRSHLR